MSKRKALGGSPLKLAINKFKMPTELNKAVSEASLQASLLARLYADKAKCRPEAECRDGDAIGGACEPAKPWHDGIRFRSPADRDKAVLAVQRMVSDIHYRTMHDHDDHERRMSAEYGTRITRLEADLREACQRDANHMIERAKNGNAA